MWAYHFGILPGTRQDGAAARARQDAGVENHSPRCGNDDLGRHGLCGERAGESRHANIGISLPGTGEMPVAPVFIDGEKSVTLRGENIAQDFIALVDDYVERRYARFPD